MWKKFIILGLLFLITGSAMLTWVLNEKSKEQKIVTIYKKKYGSETEDYLKQYDQWLKLPLEERAQLPFVYDKNGETTFDEQFEREKHERLIADMDKLAAGEMAVYPFADLFYGENWQDEVIKYKERKERNEFILNTSIVCTSMGGAIVGWFLLLWTARLVIKIALILRKAASGKFKQSKSDNNENEEDQDNENIKEINEETNSELDDLFNPDTKELTISDAETETEKQKNETLATSEPQSDKIDTKSSELTHKENQQKDLQKKDKSDTDNSDTKSAEDKGEIKTKENLTKVLPVKRRSQDKNQAGISGNKQETSKSIPAQSGEKVHACAEGRKVAMLVPPRQPSFGAKASARHQAKGSQVTDSSKPIDSTLEELTQQVSAIREYTAFQQNRLEKLQDGYDWNIIRNFGMRIIRCIDNLESRIERLEKEDIDATALIEMRDELVFALESSGIEQFKPEINSNYRGQEKFAEAVKARQECSDSKKSGKIANIIRPGYQYVINEEMVKVVRPAQVKLYA